MEYINNGFELGYDYNCTNMMRGLSTAGTGILQMTRAGRSFMEY